MTSIVRYGVAALALMVGVSRSGRQHAADRDAQLRHDGHGDAQAGYPGRGPGRVVRLHLVQDHERRLVTEQAKTLRTSEMGGVLQAFAEKALRRAYLPW
jgi:hypothetical protein